MENAHFNRRRCEKCQDAHAKRKERANKGIVLAEDAVRCPICHRFFNSITAGHYRSHGFATAKAYKQATGVMGMKAPSIASSHSAFMQENSPTKGRTRTESERELMSARRRGKGIGVSGKYERTAEIRDKISQGVALLHAQNKGDFRRGWLVPCKKAGCDVFVRSTWEERVVRVLDAHPCVVRVVIEPFIITYELDGQRRRYVPDFHITLEGNIHEVWEVKPTEFWSWGKNKAKFAALNTYVTERGWNARIVDLAQLEDMERQVGILPWREEGGPWVRPDDTSFRPRSPAEQKGEKEE